MPLKNLNYSAFLGQDSNSRQAGWATGAATGTATSEGNYGLAGVLAGARAEESAKAKPDRQRSDRAFCVSMKYYSSHMKRTLQIVCAAAFTVCAMRGQPLPSFEVASVKSFDNTNQVPHGLTSISGPRVTMNGYTLSGLIQYAYDMRPYQISGGPKWIAADTYTVTAKAEGDVAPPTAEIRKMVRSLLTERFGLALHRDTKESRIYLLEPLKTGPALTSSTAQRPTMQMAAGHLMMVKVTTTQIAAMLSSVLGRPVLDRIQIPGEFDFTLDSPDINMGRPQSQDELPGPSVFTAIQEQLGLKLEPSKGPIEILVIDRADKPAGN